LLSGVFTGLPAGTYTFSATDRNGCSTITLPVTITPPPALAINVNVISNYNGRDISCFGSSDGRAEAVVTGGTGGYTYSWFSDITLLSSIGQLTSIASNLAAGTYYVRVADANGCFIVGSVTLTQPTALDAAVTGQVNVLCYGNFTGSLTVEAVAGTGTAPYQYSINGGSTWQATGVYTGLPASSYTVLVRDANGCVRPVAATITQPTQLIAVVSASNNVSCSGGNDGSVTITVTAGSGVAPYTFSIDGGTNWQATGDFTGLTAAAYNVTVRDNNGCTVVIPVNISQPSQLLMTASPDIALNCYGNKTGTGIFNASGGTPGYTFTPIVNTADATFPAQSFNSQAFFNAGAGVITMRVVDSEGCIVEMTVTLTEPDELTPGAVTGDQVLCAGGVVAPITQVSAPAGGPAPHVYQWQYSTTDTGPFLNIAGANGNEYTPPAGATMTLYYRRMVTSGLCTPVYSNVIEKIVNPLPVALLSGGATICPGESVILKVELPIGTGPFELDIENHGTITGYISEADIVVTPLVTTTYRLLRVRDFNGCEILFPSGNLIGSALVTVRDLPVIVTPPADAILCEYGIVTFNVAATGSDLTYRWFVSDGSGFNPVVDGGVYFGAETPSLMLFGPTRLMDSLSFRAEVTGCGVTLTSDSAILTVNQVPEIITQPADTTICQGDGASFTVEATGTNLVYKWQVRSGATFVDVTDGINYSGSSTSTLTIMNAPGSFNNGIYRVRIYGDCGSPVFSNYVFLRVNLPPVVTVIPANREICADGGPVYFVANGSGMIDSIRWQVSTNGGTSWADIYDDAIYSGTTSQQLSLIGVPFAYHGNMYRLALKAACTVVNTQPATLTVNANPVVDFTAIDPVDVCGGVPMILNGNPSGGSGSYTQHRWGGDIGPLSSFTVVNPTFRTPVVDNYTLYYTVTDTKGCKGSDTLVVRVEKPEAMFTASTAAGCADLEITFTNASMGYSSLLWTFGDGFTSTEENPVHTYVNNTTFLQYFNVKLKATSAAGCVDSMMMGITVYPKSESTFTVSPDTICSGGRVTFVAAPGALQYYWVYGDLQEQPGLNVNNHTFVNPTTAPVTYNTLLTTTSTFGCISTSTMPVVVYPMPVPEFSPTPPLQQWPAATVAFTNSTNTGTWSYLWRFGDGNTSVATNPTHTYGAPGDYIVTLIASNGRCSDSVTHVVRVTPIPPVSTFDKVESGCGPLTITITNTSLHATSYLWEIETPGGNITTTTAMNPNLTFYEAGVYRIYLTATGAGGSDLSAPQTFEVYPTPTTYFQFSPDSVYVNDERVRFFNLSSGASSFWWQFGDGEESTERDPFHKYMIKGVFPVTLHSYSANGCLSSYTANPGVIVNPAGQIRFATAFIPNKTGPQTGVPISSTNIDQFFFPPVTDQVIKYKLQIFNRWGVLIFESNDINVGWDGYYKNKLVKQGVYVWIVEGKYSNGRPFNKSGDVTVLH
jgi:PKD repeat protein